jgi:hypothetical protein
VSVSGARYGQGLLTQDDERHGTERGYAAGCRLDCCRVAHTQYTKMTKVKRIARGIPERVHGTANGYNNYECRCDACQIAMLKESGRRKRARNGT